MYTLRDMIHPLSKGDDANDCKHMTKLKKSTRLSGCPGY
jgi:hypothetical protein